MQNKEDNPDNSFFAKAMNPFIIAGIALVGAFFIYDFRKVYEFHRSYAVK